MSLGVENPPPAVTLPVTLINPGEYTLAPVILPSTLMSLVMLPTKLVVPLITKFPPIFASFVWKFAYPTMLIVVFVSNVVVKAVTNSVLASFQTNAILS